MTASVEDLCKPIETFFSNTENDPMSPRYILYKRLIELGFGLRIDPVARQSDIYGDGSVLPDHVAIYESRNTSDIYYHVARDPEFEVLCRAFDAMKYSCSELSMDKCDWTDEIKKKIAAWALQNTAVFYSDRATNINSIPFFSNTSDEYKRQVAEYYKQEAEKAEQKAKEALGDLEPLNINDLQYLVEKSVRQRLIPLVSGQTELF